jgi:hypothetical protein
MIVTEIACQATIVIQGIDVKQREQKKVNLFPIFHLISNPYCISATCISTSDCSNQKPRTVCKESSQTGEKTCTKTSKSSCKDGCADGEYCAGENICRNGLFSVVSLSFRIFPQYFQ